MPQPNLEIETDICANRHGGNPESIAAFEASDRGARRAAVLNMFRRRGPSTADELVELTGLTHNNIAPRISELKLLGLLYKTGLRRPTRTGCMAAVIAAKPKQQELPL